MNLSPSQKRNINRALLIAMMIATSTVSAATGSDPLGGGICNFVNLLTGKWLFGIAILAMVGGGAALLFGAELTDGIKKAVTIVTIVGFITTFSSVLLLVFPSMSPC